MPSKLPLTSGDLSENKIRMIGCDDCFKNLYNSGGHSFLILSVQVSIE